MDIVQMLSIVISFVLGLGAVLPFLNKAKGVLNIVKEALDVPKSALVLVENVEKALEDNNISEAEIKQLIKDYKDLLLQIDELKKLL